MKAKQMNKATWMEWYSDYLLTNGKRPENVYMFARAHKSSEASFYTFFPDFERLEQSYLPHFFDKSLELVRQIEHFSAMPAKEQLLNLYFILLENFTLNRSLVLMLLGDGAVQRYSILKELKRSHREFIQTLSFSGNDLFEKASEKIKQWGGRSKEELLWLHFLSVIDFWRKDRSPGFEKTDIYIEKTIDTGFDLADNPLMNKFLDLGRFLWKEKFQMG